MSQSHHNPSGDSTIPPPPPPLTGAPKKPWAKPTVRVIGETVDDTQSGSDPAYAETNTFGAYAPTS